MINYLKKYRVLYKKYIALKKENKRLMKEVKKMAYLFNDDKSKCKVVTITGEKTIAAQSAEAALVSIPDDVQKIQVLSISQNTAINADTWRGTANMFYNNTPYPTYSLSAQGNITIMLYNEGTASRVVKYKATYMIVQ